MKHMKDKPIKIEHKIKDCIWPCPWFNIKKYKNLNAIKIPEKKNNEAIMLKNLQGRYIKKNLTIFLVCLKT